MANWFIVCLSSQFLRWAGRLVEVGMSWPFGWSWLPCNMKWVRVSDQRRSLEICEGTNVIQARQSSKAKMTNCQVLLSQKKRAGRDDIPVIHSPQNFPTLPDLEIHHLQNHHRHRHQQQQHCQPCHPQVVLLALHATCFDVRMQLDHGVKQTRINCLKLFCQLPLFVTLGIFPVSFQRCLLTGTFHAAAFGINDSLDCRVCDSADVFSDACWCWHSCGDRLDWWIAHPVWRGQAELIQMTFWWQMREGNVAGVCFHQVGEWVTIKRHWFWRVTWQRVPPCCRQVVVAVAAQMNKPITPHLFQIPPNRALQRLKMINGLTLPTDFQAAMTARPRVFVSRIAEWSFSLVDNVVCHVRNQSVWFPGWHLPHFGSPVIFPATQQERMSLPLKRLPCFLIDASPRWLAFADCFVNLLRALDWCELLPGAISWTHKLRFFHTLVINWIGTTKRCFWLCTTFWLHWFSFLGNLSTSRHWQWQTSLRIDWNSPLCVAICSTVSAATDDAVVVFLINQQTAVDPPQNDLLMMTLFKCHESFVNMLSAVEHVTQLFAESFPCLFPFRQHVFGSSFVALNLAQLRVHVRFNCADWGVACDGNVHVVIRVDNVANLGCQCRWHSGIESECFGSESLTVGFKFVWMSSTLFAQEAFAISVSCFLPNTPNCVTMTPHFLLKGSNKFQPVFFEWFIKTLLVTDQEANAKLFFSDVNFASVVCFRLSQSLALCCSWRRHQCCGVGCSFSALLCIVSVVFASTARLVVWLLGCVLTTLPEHVLVCLLRVEKQCQHRVCWCWHCRKWHLLLVASSVLFETLGIVGKSWGNHLVSGFRADACAAWFGQQHKFLLRKTALNDLGHRTFPNCFFWHGTRHDVTAMWQSLPQTSTCCLAVENPMTQVAANHQLLALSKIGARCEAGLIESFLKLCRRLLRVELAKTCEGHHDMPNGFSKPCFHWAMVKHGKKQNCSIAGNTCQDKSGPESWKLHQRKQQIKCFLSNHQSNLTQNERNGCLCLARLSQLFCFLCHLLEFTVLGLQIQQNFTWSTLDVRILFFSIRVNLVDKRGSNLPQPAICIKRRSSSIGSCWWLMQTKIDRWKNVLVATEEAEHVFMRIYQSETTCQWCINQATNWRSKWGVNAPPQLGFCLLFSLTHCGSMCGSCCWKHTHEWCMCGQWQWTIEVWFESCPTWQMAASAAKVDVCPFLFNWLIDAPLQWQFQPNKCGLWKFRPATTMHTQKPCCCWCGSWQLAEHLIRLKRL
mgnify:CR=1 FL=1